MVPLDHVLVLGKLDRPLHFFKSTKISRQALVLKLLVSGGVGYIGTHSIIEIMNAEHDISEIDDLSKSHIAALPWVKQPARRNLAFVQADLCDTTSVVRQFKCARLASTTAFQSACPRRVPAPLG